MKKIWGYITFLSILCSCSPDEGKGGLASIEGTIMQQNLNALMEKSGEPTPAIDEDVYISYGNSGLVDDKTKTGLGGTFSFSNLTKGDYTVFAISDDSSSSGKYPLATISQDVSLSSKKDKATVNFTIYKHLDYDDGGGTLKGTAYQMLYFKSECMDTIYAQDEDVYIRYKNSNAILKKIQVDYEGNFQLNNLIPGSYTLFMYSQVQNYNAADNEVVTRDFEITDNNTVCTVEPIYIKNYKKLN